jgi:hypothetical protein
LVVAVEFDLLHDGSNKATIKSKLTHNQIILFFKYKLL